MTRMFKVSYLKSTCFYLIFSLIVLYAFLVRLLGIKFGLPYLWHWDEPQAASTALQILRTGDFNPHFFNYPAFTIYTSLIIDVLHYYYLMGREVTDFDYLRSLDEIMIYHNTGWYWTISHPSFYLWNRAFISVLGTISVVLSYLITKVSYGKIAGLLAALLLAGSSFHIEHSRYITPDLPVSFFVLLVVLFSLRFNASHKLKHLLLSSICVGLATSTKYNAVVSMIVPVSAYLLNLKYLKVDKSLVLFLILILPLITFFVVNPYALLDFKTFLTHSGFEVYHYKVAGSQKPGFEHFMLQITRIKNNISEILFYLAFAGTFVLLRKPKLLFLILSFPVVYMYFMIQQKESYDRNFVVMYPFFAIFSAITISFVSIKLSQLGSFLQKRYLFRYKVNYVGTLLFLIPFVILVLRFYEGYIAQFKVALNSWKARETRTQAIEYVNTLLDKEKKETKKQPDEEVIDFNDVVIGIANELRVHRWDLKKLKARYQIFNHKDIQSALKKYTYLLVGVYGRFGGSAEEYAEVNLLNKLTPQNRIFHVIEGGGTNLDIYSINPKVIILKGSGSCMIGVDLSSLEGLKQIGADGTVWIPWNTSLRSKKIKFEKSEYDISLIAKGTEALGENARLKVYVGSNLIGDYFTTSEYKEKIFSFKSDGEQVEPLVVEFVNDYYDPEKNLDRNVWIKSITINKVD